MRKTMILPIATVISLLAVIIAITWATGVMDSNAKTVKSEPTSVTGEWHQTENGVDGVYMTASVKPGSIQINMRLRDSEHIYWLGTFSQDEILKQKATVSFSDQDAMASEIFASTDKNKVFSYKDGVLSFKFSMLGQSTVVKLSK